jgi:hypothetical protein
MNTNVKNVSEIVDDIKEKLSFHTRAMQFLAVGHKILISFLRNAEQIQKNSDKIQKNIDLIEDI